MIRHIDRLLASKTFLKIVSVLVASFLWYYVAADRSTEVVRSYSVPLEYLNAPADLSISVDIREVDVQVAGNRDIIGKMGPESITCQVDLANLEAGIHYVPVQIFTPSGVRLIEVAPSTIQMELVRMATKSVPVGLEVMSGLPPGYRLESVRFEPDTVILKGAENALASINLALVSPTLEQLETGTRLTLPVSAPAAGKDSSGIVSNPQQVTFSYVLIKGFPRKSVEVSVEIEGEPDKDFRVEAVALDPPSVKLQGPMEALETLEKVTVGPLDVSGLREDMTKVIQVTSPVAETDVVGQNTVRVKVILAPRIETRRYGHIPVNVQGTSIYPSWSVDPPSVSVLLEGVPSALDRAESGGRPVELFVDVTNLVSTRIPAPVQYRTLLRGVSLVSIDPPEVTVTADTGAAQ